MTDPDLQKLLSRSPLFRGVSLSIVASVAASAEARVLSRGERLLTAGGDNHQLFIVLDGALSVHLPELGDDPANPSNPTNPSNLSNPLIESRLAMAPGDCVGELSVLDGRPVSADVIADEPTIVIALDRERVWLLVDSSAEIARNLLRILAGRVRNDDTVLGEASRLQRYFERIATVDGLTGLRNRRWLDEAFARQLDRSARTGQAVAVLMIDVDNFKKLNDDYGHLIGDALLSRLAQILSDTLRPQDLLARYGGEEFAVLLPGLDTDAAKLVAERLRIAVETSPRDRTLPPMTISIGVATKQAWETLGDLIRRADAAMYRAKHGGRNRVSV